MEITDRVINKINRLIKFYMRRYQARKKGIRFLPPNYIHIGQFNKDDVIIDVGCGHEAEFALYCIQTYGSRALGVDPTRKHAPFLKALEEKTNGRFTYLPHAVTSDSGILTFHESIENESGSVLDSHVNVVRDHIRSYEVESLTLKQLLQKAQTNRVAFLKLDLEGAEYDLLRTVDAESLTGFEQIFVEFHHHCIPDKSSADTQTVVHRLHDVGLHSFTLDDHNYLFFWDEASV